MRLSFVRLLIQHATCSPVIGYDKHGVFFSQSSCLQHMQSMHIQQNHHLYRYGHADRQFHHRWMRCTHCIDSCRWGFCFLDHMMWSHDSLQSGGENVLGSSPGFSEDRHADGIPRKVYQSLSRLRLHRTGTCWSKRCIYSKCSYNTLN